jgi:hypothetical protein
MKLIIFLLALVMLAGCDTVRLVNPGAELPLYAASPLRLQEEWIKRGGETRLGHYTGGFYDREAREMWVDGSLDKWATAALVLHESGHPRENPDQWAVIYAMHGRGFNTRSTAHDRHEDMAGAAPWNGNDQ